MNVFTYLLICKLVFVYLLATERVNPKYTVAEHYNIFYKKQSTSKSHHNLSFKLDLSEQLINELCTVKNIYFNTLLQLTINYYIIISGEACSLHILIV